MIEGMEILKKTEILTQNYWWLLGVVGCVVALYFFAWLYYKFEDFWFIFGLLSAIGAIVCLFLVMVPTAPSGRYEYEVLLNESVGMKEVYEQYEVVGSKGEIYILEDLETTDNTFRRRDLNAYFEELDAYFEELEQKVLPNIEDEEVPNYCSNCGHSFDDTDKFCPEYGTKR